MAGRHRHYRPTQARSRNAGALRRKVAVVLFALLLAGPIYQQLVQTVDAHRFSPPGRLIDLGHATLHIHCSGVGTPTVVLEAGATGFAQSWTWVQQALSQQTRVCSYDRAGLGWSERHSTVANRDASARHSKAQNNSAGERTSAGSYTGLEAARNLRKLLLTAQEPGPYVMVGHSMGGPLVQIFTGLYPETVVGVGLVDPSHPNQLKRYRPEAPAAMEQFVNSLRVASTLTHVGVVRLTNILARNAQGLPSESYDTAKFFASSPEHLTASYRELEQWDDTMRVARTHMDLGRRPLLVISATEAREDFPEHFVKAFHTLHSELARTSSDSVHIKIKGADHFSLLTQRRYAEQTAQALADLLQRVRQRNHLPGSQLAGASKARNNSQAPM